METKLPENFNWEKLTKRVSQEAHAAIGDIISEPSTELNHEAMRLDWDHNNQHKYTVDRIHSIEEEIENRTLKNISSPSSEPDLRLEHLMEELEIEKSKLPEGLLQQYRQLFPKNPSLN